MRIALAVVVALSGVASADPGAYAVVDVGGSAMRGDLDGMGPAVHFRGGLGVTIHDWAVEGWYGADASVAVPFSTPPVCNAPPGGACADGGGGFSATDHRTLYVYGFDVRRAFTIVEGHPSDPRVTWLRPRVQAFLHAGIRDAHGTGNMDGLHGTGVGAGAGIDVALSVYTSYVEFGGDRFDLGDGMSNAQSWHIVFGERIGFGM